MTIEFPAKKVAFLSPKLMHFGTKICPPFELLLFSTEGIATLGQSVWYKTMLSRCLPNLAEFTVKPQKVFKNWPPLSADFFVHFCCNFLFTEIPVSLPQQDSNSNWEGNSYTLLTSRPQIKASKRLIGIRVPVIHKLCDLWPIL